MVDELADEIFEATEIEPTLARKAFSLVRHTHPAVSLAQWLEFTERWARAPFRRGILALQDRRGSVHAIFWYRVDCLARDGPVLRVSDLIVAQLPGGVIDHAIVRTVERLASDIGCRSVFFEPGPRGMPGKIMTPPGSTD
jgi:hypothetical protein